MGVRQFANGRGKKDFWQGKHFEAGNYNLKHNLCDNASYKHWRDEKPKQDACGEEQKQGRQMRSFGHQKVPSLLFFFFFLKTGSVFITELPFVHQWIK